jgi:hypothetical protein
MKLLNDSATVAARAAAKAIGLHVAPWLDAAAVAACVKSGLLHRDLLDLRGKWEADGKPAAGETVVRAALAAYMEAREASSIESKRCLSL